VELQPIFKALIASGVDKQQLYLRGNGPQFLVRVLKRVYKRKPNELVVEIRNSDENKECYSAVTNALSVGGVSFRERMTPRTRKPKSLTVAVEIGTFAVPGLSNVLEIAFKGAGVDLS
jgi:hypothetical protein